MLKMGKVLSCFRCCINSEKEDSYPSRKEPFDEGNATNITESGVMRKASVSSAHTTYTEELQFHLEISEFSYPVPVRFKRARLPVRESSKLSEQIHQCSGGIIVMDRSLQKYSDDGMQPLGYAWNGFNQVSRVDNGSFPFIANKTRRLRSFCLRRALSEDWEACMVALHPRHTSEV